MRSKWTDARPVKRKDLLTVDEVPAMLDLPRGKREEQRVSKHSDYGFTRGKLVRGQVVTEIAYHHPEMMLVLPWLGTLDDDYVGETVFFFQ